MNRAQESRCTGRGTPRRVYELAASYIFIAFIGWVFEKVGRYFVYGSISDRGFLSLPLCPIYATSVIGVYLLFGTPKRLRLLAKRIDAGVLKGTALYFLFSAVAASAVELCVGVFFESAFGLRLWDYSERAFDVFGHVCLSYSLLWGGILTAFMFTVWKKLESAVKSIPQKKLTVGVFVIYGAVLADFIFNIFYLCIVGSHFKFL